VRVRVSWSHESSGADSSSKIVAAEKRRLLLLQKSNECTADLISTTQFVASLVPPLARRAVAHPSGGKWHPDHLSISLQGRMQGVTGVTC